MSLVPKVFSGSIFPDVLSGEIERAWSVYFAGDTVALERSLKLLDEGRAALAEIAAAPEGAEINTNQRRGQRAVLGMVELHIAMLNLRIGTTGSTQVAVERFHRAANQFDPNCTPRLHALAKLGEFEARAKQTKPTEEMLIEATRALAMLPPHENRPVYCVGARHFLIGLRAYVGEGATLTEADASYFDDHSTFLAKTCS
jgi:hypothetical protein